MGILWLRSEVKPGEQRAPLSPHDIRILIKNGHTVYIESSLIRIFKDKEYEDIGGIIVPPQTWASAPKEALILGLKYLPDIHEIITHRHCYFSHAYSLQRIFTEKIGVSKLMKAFRKGGGELYDIEFLLDPQRKRVAAFGFFAGYAGAAIGIFVGEQKCKGIKDFKVPLKFFSCQEIVKNLSASLGSMREKSTLIIGSQGRCGQGVKALFDALHLPYTEWTRKETSNPNLRKTIVDYDVVYNCTSAKEKTEPFLTKSCLVPFQKLSLLIDVGCETSQNNFFPIYPGPTTFENPTHRIEIGDFYLDVIAIDNLPNALPYNSSLDFSSQILPHLNDILNGCITLPWKTAKKIFDQHIKSYEEK
jgi:saccharopine dehydrogenase (NAD+, L-lysine-forming)